MRGDQLARQWQLIQRLARSRAGVGLDALADDLGCVRRTVYRDLDALQYAGFPVVSERREGRVVYRFLDTFGLGDVPFTTDEVLALAFGEDLLRPLEGTVFHDSIRSALHKIRVALGPEVGAFVERLGESFRVLPGPHKRYARYREVIQVLNEAVLGRRTVRMGYRTGRTGQLSTRLLDPYRIWYRSGGLYVIGHDHRSGEVRTFAVDRIERLSLLEERFTPLESLPDEAFPDSLGVHSGRPEHVEIAFEAGAADYVRARTWHPSQKVRETEEGGLVVSLDVCRDRALTSWILSFGPFARVLAPDALAREVAAQFDDARERYRDDEK
jgi:predicted DNA-binding transcriptional regulator YafY